MLYLKQLTYLLFGVHSRFVEGKPNTGVSCDLLEVVGTPCWWNFCEGVGGGQLRMDNP